MIDGGVFRIGTNDPWFRGDGEAPELEATVDAFYIDRFEVSNRRYADFVQQNPEYQTDAERFGWSFVHEQALSPEVLANVEQSVHNVPWWLKVYEAFPI